MKKILLVEDNDGDAQLLKMCLFEHDPEVILDIYQSAELALHDLCSGAVLPNPDLIILDYNLPGMNGEDLLRSLKQNVHLKKIPAIVFTSSESKQDITAAYNVGANAYLTKPISLEELSQLSYLLIQFWLKNVKVSD